MTIMYTKEGKVDVSGWSYSELAIAQDVVKALDRAHFALYDIASKRVLPNLHPVEHQYIACARAALKANGADG